jgi:hypothetical protein
VQTRKLEASERERMTSSMGQVLTRKLEASEREREND